MGGGGGQGNEKEKKVKSIRKKHYIDKMASLVVQALSARAQ
jgi:hypothetical protein